MSPAAVRRNLPAAELLAVDLEAELRRLGEAQVQGLWQLPAELVRLALARGATAVCVSLRRNGFEVSHDTGQSSPARLGLLAEAFDRRLPVDRRQGAISALEEAGELALLWLCGAPGARVRVSSEEGRFELDRARPALVKGGRSERTVAVAASLPRFDRARASSWLDTVCRFAPVPVTVNGRVVPQGPAGAMLRLRLRAPLAGQVWVTATGDAPRIYLLKHGVVASRAVIPDYPAFVAAVELGGSVPVGAAPAVQRAAVTPLLPQLIDQALELLLRAAARPDALTAESRRRAVLLLLEAARKRLRREEVSRLPLVTLLDAGGERLASLEELQRLAAGGSLSAVEPGRRPRDRTPSTPTVVAGESERAMLSEIIGLRLETAPRRPLRSRLSSALEAALRSTLARLRLRRHARVLADDELSPRERSVLAELRRVLVPSGLEVALADGADSPRRSSRQLVLPRSNPLIAACLLLADREPQWLYPVTLALLDGVGEPPAELRQRWVRGMMAGRPATNGAAPRQ